jgi:hypothetical protein
MDSSNPSDDRTRPDILEVPELPRLLCAGEDILERAHDVRQTFAEAVRLLLEDDSNLTSWDDWEVNNPDRPCDE